jgi:hypothetical protein
MRALVVYESMYGNTHAVAIGIAASLRASHDVTVVPVTRATRELVDAADLLVVGGPTHAHGLSTGTSRRSALQAARQQGTALTVDPDADGPGLRGWLAGLGAARGLAVAFDTRMAGSPLLTGQASRGIARHLKRHGYRMVAAPESFLVTRRNALLPGESEHAASWGAMIGAAASDRLARAR